MVTLCDISFYQVSAYLHTLAVIVVWLVLNVYNRNEHLFDCRYSDNKYMLRYEQTLASLRAKTLSAEAAVAADDAGADSNSEMDIQSVDSMQMEL